MAWISYTSAGGTAGLAAFETANPNAVVVVSENEIQRCAIDHKAGGVFVKIDAIEHVTVKEYRGLTRATAVSLKSGVSGNGKIMLKFTYVGGNQNLHTLNCPSLVGTERQCAISRANEADGYTLTVTESTTDWDAAVSGNYVSYGGAGTSFGTIVKGDVYIKYGADV